MPSGSQQWVVPGASDCNPSCQDGRAALVGQTSTHVQSALCPSGSVCLSARLAVVVWRCSNTRLLDDDELARPQPAPNVRQTRARQWRGRPGRRLAWQRRTYLQCKRRPTKYGRITRAACTCSRAYVPRCHYLLTAPPAAPLSPAGQPWAPVVASWSMVNDRSSIVV